MTAMINKKREERLKEELRKLSQHEDNKTCFVCGMRGPLYVVLDFSTFVCSTCSAVHRSLQHKVKGVSMSEFSEGEVSVLRIGGNSKAATIWKQNYRGPNVAVGDEGAAREMIRQVFVERRYLNAPALHQQEEANIQATLPPVTVLKSLDDLPMGGVPTRTAEKSAAPVAQVATSSKPSGATPAPPPALHKATVDGLDFFDAPQPTPPPPAQPTQSTGNDAGDDFDSFFGSRGSAAVNSNPTPASAATTGGGRANVGVGDLFGPSVTAAPLPAHHQPFAGPNPSAHDFFGAPHTAAAHSTQAQSQTNHDFFGGSDARQPPSSAGFFTPPVVQHPPAHGRSAATGQDFFQAASWEPNRTSALSDGPAHPFSAPLPSQPPPRTTVAHAADAFADLDPFQGKRR